MFSYLRFILLLLAKGKVVRTGPNFNTLRAAHLRGLDQFIPATKNQSGKTSRRSLSYFTALKAQLGFLIQSYRTRGAHLSDSNISYIRIPKAASTSAGAMMLKLKFQDLQTQQLTNVQVNALIDVNIDTKITAGQSYFTFVRNPFARIVSVYRSFFEKKGEEFLYEAYLFGILKQSMTFEEFVEIISKIPDQLKDQHFKPQHLLVKPYLEKGMQVHIMKVEETSALDQFLHRHSLSLPFLNPSPPVDYSRYYTPYTINLVSVVYKDDISIFNYHEELSQLKVIAG